MYRIDSRMKYENVGNYDLHCHCTSTIEWLGLEICWTAFLEIVKYSPSSQMFGVSVLAVQRKLPAWSLISLVVYLPCHGYL